MSTYLVGYTPDAGGQAALALARLLAGQSGATVVVCVVTPEVWGYPSLARVDQEYGKFLDEYAESTLEHARTQLADMPQARFERVAAASATEGLTRLADSEHADMIVLGSAREGAVGRLLLGGVTDEILHLATMPVAIAPVGFSVAVPLGRITVAFSGGEAARSTALHALGLAGALKVPLRLISFAVRDQQMFPPLGNRDAEALVLQGWLDQAEVSLNTVRDQIAVTGYPVEVEVGVGSTWEEAQASLHWQDGDILLLGSSRLGAFKRVFLGSNAAKIMRSSPVPVIVLPRHN